MKTHRNRPTEKIRRFTLVELVAAMAIMIFVALIIGTASAAFFNAWKRSARVTDRLKVCQNIDRVMDVCVRNMILFSWKDEDEVERVVFQGDVEEIFFVSRRRAVEGDDSAFLFIRLKVNEDQQLVAEYSTLPRFPWDEENKYEMKTEVLADNVVSIRFLYARMEEDEIVWDEDWEEYDQETFQENEDDVQPLPLAVQMTVEWKDGTKEVWLRRTAGNSRYSRLGGSSGLPRSEAAAAGTGNYGNNRGGGTRAQGGGQGGGNRAQGSAQGGSNRGGQGGGNFGGGGQGGSNRGGQGSGNRAQGGNRGGQGGGGNRGGGR